jgi:hypothetical protein
LIAVATREVQRQDQYGQRAENRAEHVAADTDDPSERTALQ